MSTIAFTEPQSFTAHQPFMRRVAPRRKVAIPLNVTILRSGVPDAVPGRSVDVGEGGIGAVLAAELFPGELVGVEFRLPDSGSVLAKARVCYQERLRCGLQFLSIAPEQKEMLGAWTLDVPRRPAQIVVPEKPAIPAKPVRRVETPLPKFLADSSRRSEKTPTYLKRKIFMLLAASVIVAGGVGWWQWQQGWEELESRLPERSVEASQPPVAVGFEVMQGLLVHKVDPMAPTDSRVRGVAVVSAVIGRDGSVIAVRPVSGLEPLTRAAMDSVQWWKFEPYRQNGVPVEVETSLAIEFR
ncbi:MAG TPA: PilZ domain-containing protein [Terriglobales bacterium]|nr:PilZ domain-containing protein [Terriglobales bacterium]